MTQTREIKRIPKDEVVRSLPPKQLDVTLKRQVISVITLLKRDYPEEMRQIVEICLAK